VLIGAYEPRPGPTTARAADPLDQPPGRPTTPRREFFSFSRRFFVDILVAVAFLDATRDQHHGMDPLRDLLRRYLADEPYRQLTPDELWARFRDHREEGAFRVLLERVGGRVYARCRVVLGNDAEVEEVFQEAFVALVRDRARLPTYGAAAAWLYETATNKARQAARHRRRAAHRERAWAAATPEAGAGAGDPDMIRREESASLAAALAELPGRQRRAVELVYLEGLTYDEAARALGWSRGAVGTYVRRGLDRLQGILRRRGVLPAVGGAAALEAVRAQALSPERAASVAEAVLASVDSPAAAAGAWWPWSRKVVVGLGLLTGAAAAVGVWWAGEGAGRPSGPPAQLPPPPAALPAPAETLQARNLRIVRDEIVDPLRDLLQGFYPPDNPVQLAGVRAFGSEVEVEFRTSRPPPAPLLAARLRGRYCTFRRRLVIHGQPAGEDRWYWMNPAKPLALPVSLPFGPGVELVRGREAYAVAERLFDRLPPDERAGPELLRSLFGPPGGGLLLPADTRGVSGFAGGLILAVGNDGLFARDGSGQWRDAGECPGWSPVVAGGRVYCYGGGVIRSRPLADRAAAWEKWCDEPPVGPGERRVGILFVAGGRLYETVAPHAHYSRPLADPAAGWSRVECPLGEDGLAAVGGTLFGHDGKQLFARPAADPAGGWNVVGPWPEGCRKLVADGDRLLAFAGWKPGSIYARPAAAGPDVPWVVAGRVHDPYER
jgi:RNA polymerase sigma factor (sigma-70 family)